MKIAIRHILVTLAWVGLFLGRWASANDWAAPQPTSNGHAEVIPRGETMMPDADPSVVGEHQMPIGGVFGDTPPAACESCGGGGCMPAKWSFDSSLKIFACTRASQRVLSTNSLPGGPFQVSATGITPIEYRYFNDAVQNSVMTVHSLNFDVSPAWNFKISRFLGRDGESRDNFIDFEYSGLDRFAADHVAQGGIVPIYSTTATFTDPTTPPTITGYHGSLNSPFPFPSSTQPFADPTNAFAFNRAVEQSAFYVSTLNEWELNYRFAGHNQPDQLVLNPNGRWYRQCQTGFFYSYLFGFRAMVINDRFDYLSHGETRDASGFTTLINSGQYVVRSYNTMLGLQTGGTLQYRFCRWSLETHGKVGMFLNVASQNSLIQTQLHGFLNNDPNQPIDSDKSNPFGANNTVAAFAGGFGLQGNYKFRPNLVGHLSYDMTWVGDVARAPDQMAFTANPVGALNTKGAIFYNGVTMGLEFDW